MGNQQERSLAWLAGIVDGEGSITFQTTFRKDGNACVYPFLCIVNSDEGILTEAQKILEGLVAGRKTGTVHNFKIVTSVQGFHGERQCRSIRINGTATKLVLEAIYPYLRSSKRRNAEVVLEFLKSRESGLLNRDSKGRLRRMGYTRSEIELATSIRTHKRAKSSEAICSAPNVVG